MPHIIKYSERTQSHSVFFFTFCFWLFFCRNWNITLTQVFSPYDEVPLAAITALSLPGYDATSFAHLDSWIFCCFLCRSSEALSGWMVNTRFSPEMFDWVQLRTVTGLPKGNHKSCPLAISPLEGQPSALSQFLSTLGQVFIKAITEPFSVQLFLNPDQSLSAAAE